jgi:hypothetical protein
MATCPACAEPIPVATENCPHCGIDVRRFAPGGTRSVGGRMSGLTIGLLIGGGVFNTNASVYSTIGGGYSNGIGTN